MVRRREAPSRTMRPVAHPSRRAQGRAPQDEAGDRMSRLVKMAVASIQVSETPLVLYTLRRADDALILGHRLSEWCGHAPMLEEDMALANMGLDLLGQARELYSYAAEVEGKGNDEDNLAYLRDVRQDRNLLLLEQPNGDFARTMVPQFFYAVFAAVYCAGVGMQRTFPGATW